MPAGQPSLDLVAVALQLFDLLLEIHLVLLLLVLLRRAIDLVPDLVEELHPLLHLLQAPFHLRQELAVFRHREVAASGNSRRCGGGAARGRQQSKDAAAAQRAVRCGGADLTVIATAKMSGTSMTSRKLARARVEG